MRLLLATLMLIPTLAFANGDGAIPEDVVNPAIPLAVAPPALAPSSGEVSTRGGAVSEDSEHSLFGIPFVAHGAMQVSQPFDVRQWGVGFEGGVEMNFSPAYLIIRGELADILDDSETYPYNGRMVMVLGTYVTNEESVMFGLPTAAYGGFQVSQQFNLREWAMGFEAGLEFDMDPGYMGVRLELFDVLTGDEDEVYGMDGRVAFVIGGYM